MCEAYIKSTTISFLSTMVFKNQRMNNPSLISIICYHPLYLSRQTISRKTAAGVGFINKYLSYYRGITVHDLSCIIY